MEDPAGTTLGRYQVLKHLASGGMAQVLLARSTGIEGFERHVVIKRIHRERVNDENAVKMFLDEARLAASLHHTNIVQVHDIGQEKGEYFFTMEYVHGEDLRHLLTLQSRKGAFIPFEHIVTIVSGAAAGLHYAHEHRGPDRKPLAIVHRDVSPANIIVGYDGTVKVVDFGIAKAALRSSDTQSGTLKGKISYMSPEQCLGEPIDRRSDVFALGIVLYELATVRRLFKGTSEFLTMSQIVAGNIPPPSEHRADVPQELEDIIMKALEPNPAERYQTADEMRLALDKFGKRSSTTELADYMEKVFGRRPEPWLVSDDDLDDTTDVDFDGAGAGLAATVSGQRLLTPPPGSLLARAKRKVARPAGIPLVSIPKVADAAATEPTQELPASTQRPTPESVTAMAWEPSGKIEQPRSRRGLVIGALATVAVIAGVAFVMKGPGRSEKLSTEVAPAAAAPAPPPVTTEPPPPPTEKPPIVEPTAIVTVETPSQPVAKKVSTTAKRPAKAVKKPVKKPERKPGWDPTALLPE